MSLVEYGTIEQQTPTGKWIDLIAPAAALANQIAKTEFVPQEMRGSRTWSQRASCTATRSASAR